MELISLIEIWLYQLQRYIQQHVRQVICRGQALLALRESIQVVSHGGSCSLWIHALYRLGLSSLLNYP